MHHIKDIQKRVVLITGASSGFGEACARYLNQKGYCVYGTSRRAEFGQPPDKDNSGTSAFHMIPMDVRDQQSVEAGINHILDRDGAIDIVMNNAGYSLSGAVEDFTIDEIKGLFETNFLGVLRVCKAVLPQMRSRNAGYIINISSIGGVMGLPYQGAYSASKFALEGISEALRIEVKPFGIHVVLIEPGDFKTDVTKNRVRAKGAVKDSVYYKRFNSTVALMENEEQSGLPPVKLAVLVEKIINNPNPKVRYTIGKLEQRLSTLYKRWAPSLMYEKSFMKYYKLI
ncbi:MAG: SDR family oxidoreductase [Desulfobacteraceae bacterium]|nr:SDR family oxidoreductase [Desulfobacteraceae bacterium]MBC2755507.1 SDR family oxidoreductase [Desulfobacteraceae bacterium]